MAVPRPPGCLLLLLLLLLTIGGGGSGGGGVSASRGGLIIAPPGSQQQKDLQERCRVVGCGRCAEEPSRYDVCAACSDGYVLSKSGACGALSVLSFDDSRRAPLRFVCTPFPACPQPIRALPNNLPPPIKTDCAPGYGSSMEALSFVLSLQEPPMPIACQPPNAPAPKAPAAPPLPPCKCARCPQGTSSAGGALGSREAACSKT